MHEAKKKPEYVVIVRAEGPPVCVLASEVDARCDGETAEYYLWGQPSQLPTTPAEALAAAVLQGDREAALMLADEILMNHENMTRVERPAKELQKDGEVIVVNRRGVEYRLGEFRLFCGSNPMQGPHTARCPQGHYFTMSLHDAINVDVRRIICPTCGESQDC